ncbi:notch-regulated ankyrin repeat-containing protein [Anolis carolinensis]|uniref:notch-regulated ankyrin repeat-containing protein n=1 Tax=Anolis carolinensis TaxID=28377 RepID=UPI002F2B3EF0
MSQTEVSPCGAAGAAASSASSSSCPAPLGSSSGPGSPSLPGSQRVFQEAVRAGNTAALQALLQGMSSCEFNVNAFGPEGQTALHQSVIEGNLELVKLLVKFGADARLANRDGWSALHIAAFGGHQDIVLYLVTRAKYACAGRGAAQGGGAGPAQGGGASR